MTERAAATSDAHDAAGATGTPGARDAGEPVRSPTPVLELDRVTAGYLGDIDVLREVSMRVDAGRITGMIGLNGAGKSTVMKTICGFLRPKAGRIRLRGADIGGIAPHTLIDHDLWYIPQESSLFPYMSVEQNLRLPVDGRAAKFGDADERLRNTLERFPVLRDKLKSAAGDLSGGQQKTLEFAKAYMVRPTLCLIDEPSIGLAPKVAREVFEWIDLFAKSGMAILLVDHNVRRVVRMSDWIYVLSLGQISASGRREDFQGDLHDQVREWLGINF